MNKNKEWYEHRNKQVTEDYKKLETTVEKISEKYNMTTRQIQRIVKSQGFSRTISEANKLASKYKDYSNLRKPEHLKAKRKGIKKSLRYFIIKNHPYCAVCGNTMMQCPLNVDHVDNDATNNNPKNLQVLCMDCNQGKKLT